MAALFRQKTSDYTINEHVEVDTEDHEDHTFSGVMFTIEAKAALPIDFIQVTSLSVRGALGPLTVWVTSESWEGKQEDEEEWTKVYDKTHKSSMRSFVPLVFDEPVIIPRGESIGVYVHSRRRDDEALVYDNQRSRYTHTDQFIRVGPGLAHLSSTPFSGSHPWGAWRERRQFVGRVSYGAKFELWNPDVAVHSNFPPAFQDVVRLFLYLKPQDNCPLSWMSNDVLFYILNMCRHDWCAPTPQRVAQIEATKEEKKKAKAAAKAKAERAQLRARNAFLRSRGIEIPEGQDEGESSSNNDDDNEEGGGAGGGGGGSSSSSSMMVHARRAAAESSDSDEDDSDGGLGLGRAFGRPTYYGRGATTRGEAMRWMLRHFTGAGADDDDDDYEEEDDDEDDVYYQEIDENESEDSDDDDDDDEEEDEDDDDDEVLPDGGTSSAARQAWADRVFGADSPSEEGNEDDEGAITRASEGGGRMEPAENGDEEEEEADDQSSPSSYEAPAKAYRRKRR